MGRRTYCLTLSYDGTRYRGWQRLPGADTIQGRVEKALSEIFGTPVEIQGSGRTDAGVHALGQTASFEAETRCPEQVLRELRRLLPSDIGALKLEYREPRFHARLSAVEKTYVYRVWNSERPDVFERRYRYFLPAKLNQEKMREGAALLTGTHDFLAFCSNRHYKKSSVRTLYALDMEENGEELVFTLRADGFLWNMARILVGTLLEIGLGKREPSSIPGIFASRRRENAGETAPARGLCLKEVTYP